MALGLSHHVHAVIHPVNEVNIRVSGRTEHDFRPPGQAFGRMRGQIVRAKVRLHFHNPADALHIARYVNQAFPEEFTGDHNRVPIVK